MPWKKSPPELIEAFDAALPADARVERRQMFGYPCAFARGRMFTGLHEEHLMVRLAEAKRAELLRVPGAALFEPMRGRVMREYVVVPRTMIGDQPALRAWMQAALRYVVALPPKAGKRKTTAKKRKK